MTQDNLKFRVEKIEEDKVSLVILIPKIKFINQVLKTISWQKVRTSWQTKNYRIDNEPTNNGSLSLDTNILLKNTRLTCLFKLIRSD